MKENTHRESHIGFYKFRSLKTLYILISILFTCSNLGQEMAQDNTNARQAYENIVYTP